MSREQDEACCPLCFSMCVIGFVLPGRHHGLPLFTSHPVAMFNAFKVRANGIKGNRRIGVGVHADIITQQAQLTVPGIVFRRGMDVPLRYNNDKRKKPLFSRGLSVCRHLFNSFSKLKCDEKIIEKRRLFH